MPRAAQAAVEGGCPRCGARWDTAKAFRRGTRPDGSEGAVEGGVVGFYSLEMSAEQLAARVLSEASEIPS